MRRVRASAAPQGVRDAGRLARTCSWPWHDGHRRASAGTKLHGWPLPLEMLDWQRAHVCTRHTDEGRWESTRRVDLRLRAKAICVGFPNGVVRWRVLAL